MWAFEIPGEPTGKGRPRFNSKTGRTYTPAKTAHYENLAKLAFRQAYPDAEPIPAGVPVNICIIAWFSIPASASKSKHLDMSIGKIRPTKKPDTDNIAKIICDALNGLAYHDDAQIVSLQVIKRYNGTSGCFVRIQEAK